MRLRVFVYEKKEKREERRERRDKREERREKREREKRQERRERREKRGEERRGEDRRGEEKRGEERRGASSSERAARTRLYGKASPRDSSEKARRKIAKKFEELRRTCCEEADRARQERIDELSMHQERNLATVSQLLAQIQDLHNKVNSLADAREFYDPETASSSGVTHVPSKPSTIPSPRTMPCPRFGISARYTEFKTGASRNLCERPPAQEGRPSTFFNKSKNMASSSQELRPDITGTTKRPESEMKREPLNTSNPFTIFPEWRVEC